MKLIQTIILSFIFFKICYACPPIGCPCEQNLIKAGFDRFYVNSDKYWTAIRTKGMYVEDWYYTFFMDGIITKNKEEAKKIAETLLPTLQFVTQINSGMPIICIYQTADPSVKGFVITPNTYRSLH